MTRSFEEENKKKMEKDKNQRVPDEGTLFSASLLF